MIAGDEPAFGAFPPTRDQAKLIARFNGTLLGGTRLRRKAFDRFMRDHKGPVDSTLFGYRVRFYPCDNSPDMKAVICGAKFNEPELKWLGAALPRGGAFVDVGANFGFFTLAAAQRDARICAIEPNPDLFARLTYTLTLNGLADKVARFECAAGPAAGKADLGYAADAAGARIGEAGGAHRHEVQVRPLLAMVKEAGFSRIDLLKIDIEGYEDQALVPFFNTAPEDLWPVSMLMEDAWRHKWREDLLGLSARLGYRKVARSRGNVWLRRA
jgi:FkbM family methyltransferase